MGSVTNFTVPRKAAVMSSINEIDKEISDVQDTLSLLPRSSSQRFASLSFLADLRLHRYFLGHNGQDLETSILLFTHAILLPPHLSTGGDLDLVYALFYLSNALYLRSDNLKQPRDVKDCIQYLHYLRDQSLEGPKVSCKQVKSLIVIALEMWLNFEPRNAMQDVEEMSVLCHELLASDLPPVTPVASFARAVINLLDLLIKPSPQIMECVHMANARLPDLHDISFTLSLSLAHRFHETRSIADYENAMASLDKIIASHSPDNPSQYIHHALRTTMTLARGRFATYETPEYLEEAIFRLREYLSAKPHEDPGYRHGDLIRDLESLERTRFREFGIANGLPKLHSSSPEVVDPPSFSDLIASLPKSNAVEPPLTADEHIRHHDALSSMFRITDKVVIEEGVKYCRLLLASLKHPLDDSIMTPRTTATSGYFLLHAFELTHNPEYLNESIDVFYATLNLPLGRSSHFFVIRFIIVSLFSRLKLSEDRKDFDEIINLYSIAITDAFANVPDRFNLSCRWAQDARYFKHASTSNAYESAVSLMQDSLTFAPTLEIQHFRLIAMRDSYEKLPLDHASYLINIGLLKQAIETLERGRGLLWSEMRGLHTAIDQVHIVDSHLARKFAAVNRDLEALTTSSSPNLWTNDGPGEDDGNKEMNPFGRLVVRQRKLLDERNGLIMQIRSLPGLGNFLMAPSFETLCSSAARGPVVLINHSEWRSDIIILLYNRPPSLIPTPHDFYDRANGLRDKLLVARKEGLESRGYEDALTSVLETLYDLIGRSVIQKLHELNVPEQSRVWWCPTSVFCSLPLHAMGPIRSDGLHKLYFSDLYIPSYTPTLTALAESCKPGSHLSGKPSILLVAQPDESIPGSWKEISLIRRLKVKVTTLISKKATPSAVLNGLKDHRFAHFSCHGILDTGKPFDASFKLYGGERLTLLDIIRSRLPSAEFAFLAACHTAELTEESIADEGLHLTAAVQYSGFRSVVGTMWEMVDIDGEVLAKNFYGSVFSDKWQDVPYYERTAEALRDAVKVLRRKGNVSTERWVNFVHYGA